MDGEVAKELIEEMGRRDLAVREGFQGWGTKPASFYIILYVN